LINPVRSEREAFRFLVYVLVIAAMVVGVVVLARAL